MNAIGQRQTVSTSGTAMASPATTRWSYDALGQLVAEDFANNQAANPRDRGYAYDLIGNRENSIQGNTNPLAAGNLAYDANPLNQYTSIGAFQPVHDDDGNLTSGQLHAGALSSLTGTPYTASLAWNAENRLAEVKEGTAVKAIYQYDFMGRRVRKQVGSIVTWYVYDGFNELGRFTQTGTGAPAIQRTFTWGLDISNTPQGAGGVGGLLAVKVHGTTSATYFPTYDANGNISEYLASNGSVTAHFEYDGFGNTVVNTDTNGLFDYRFSTKPLEDVTGLYYYLYRDYDPVTGRWASRDPIGERGGVNLYGFTGNKLPNKFDVMGMIEAPRPNRPIPPAGTDLDDIEPESEEPRITSITYSVKGVCYGRIWFCCPDGSRNFRLIKGEASSFRFFTKSNKYNLPDNAGTNEDTVISNAVSKVLRSARAAVNARTIEMIKAEIPCKLESGPDIDCNAYLSIISDRHDGSYEIETTEYDLQNEGRKGAYRYPF